MNQTLQAPRAPLPTSSWPTPRWAPTWSALLAIVVLHAVGLAAVITHLSAPPIEVTPPTMIGVLVAPPTVQRPQPLPAAPEPPKPIPVVKQRPTPLPPLPVAPPSERAVTAPPAVPPAPTDPTPNVQTAAATAPPSHAEPASGPAQVTPPRTDASQLNNPAPAYPAASRRLGEQGKVVFDVYILPDGTVGEIKLKRSSGYSRLDDAALDAVKRWRYVPAHRGSEAIPYWYVQPISFSLGG